MTDFRIGFAGLGQMGAPMARRLMAQGLALTVYDINPESVARLAASGAETAPSPQALAQEADVVFVSLPTPAIVREVALGTEGLQSGSRMKTFVDMSTTGPRVAREVAAALAARGVRALDCPVSGGIAGATEGRLTLMVSGSPSAFEEIKPVLGFLGAPTFVSEAPGAAQTLKLANNLLAACAIAITSEACVFGVKSGLDPKVMCEVFSKSSGVNTATLDKFPRSVLPGTFNFGFATGLAYKDVKLCLDEAEALGVPTPVGAAVRQMLSITQAEFGPDSDFTSMVRPLERWAQVEVRSKAAS